MFSPESLWCVCVGVGEVTNCVWVRSRSLPGLVRTGPCYHHLVFTYPCFSRLCLSPRLLGHLASLLRVLRAWPWHLRLGAEGSGKGWPLCLPAELELCAHLSLEWPQLPPASSWSPKYPPFPLSIPSGTRCHRAAADSAQALGPKGWNASPPFRTSWLLCFSPLPKCLIAECGIYSPSSFTFFFLFFFKSPSHVEHCFVFLNPEQL